MNWQQISIDSPKAFRKFIRPLATPAVKEIFDTCNVIKTPENGFIFGSVFMNKAMKMPYHRILYDFFDMQLIFINPTAVNADIILIDNTGKLLHNETTPNVQGRAAAEFAAFEIAFKILERLINEANATAKTSE